MSLRSKPLDEVETRTSLAGSSGLENVNTPKSHSDPINRPILRSDNQPDPARTPPSTFLFLLLYLSNSTRFENLRTRKSGDPKVSPLTRPTCSSAGAALYASVFRPSSPNSRQSLEPEPFNLRAHTLRPSTVFPPATAGPKTSSLSGSTRGASAPRQRRAPSMNGVIGGPSQGVNSLVFRKMTARRRNGFSAIAAE